MKLFVTGTRGIPYVMGELRRIAKNCSHALQSMA